uniref:Uncharacterized protein n=1 Tax=Caenorhabditis japonica TaxID=281687 RepID=A0A8R1ES69_CAEJA
MKYLKMQCNAMHMHHMFAAQTQTQTRVYIVSISQIRFETQRNSAKKTDFFALRLPFGPIFVRPVRPFVRPSAVRPLRPRFVRFVRFVRGRSGSSVSSGSSGTLYLAGNINLWHSL